MSEFSAFAKPWTDAELDEHGLRPVTDGGRLFCGVTAEAFAINGVTYGWKPGSKIKIGLEFSRLGQLSDMDCKDAITVALKEIRDCCGGIDHEIVSNPDFANIYLQVRRLDGAMGVLADCEIPQPGSTPDGTRLRMRFDDSEAWVISETPQQGQIDFYRVFLHEVEHGHGLGHKPANIAAAALIAPTYSRTLRNLQPADKAEFVRRYGPPKVQPVPPPTPTPGVKPVTVTVEQDGKRWSGPVPRVQ